MRIDRRALRWVPVIATAIYLIGFAFSADRPWLLYNHTPSVPIGFYILRSGAPNTRIRRGDLVAFALPRAAYNYARQRGDSTHVRLLKPVLAVAGDHVSTLHGKLRINGAFVCNIPDTDSAGRVLPHWRHACTLKPGELFVGSTRIADSFGSRFFGPIHVAQVIGVYRPWWLLPFLDLPKAALHPMLPPAIAASVGVRHRDTTGATEH